MDKEYSIANLTERKRGQHLGSEERGAIQALKKQGFSNRAIARIINCSPSTVGYELGRGTPAYSGRGRKPGYSAKRGAAVYKVNRSRCHRSKTISRDSAFIRWMVDMIRKHGWSLQIKWEYDIISIWNEVNSKIAKRTPFRVATSKGGFSHVR